MNSALWALQVILSIKLITVSYTHGLQQGKPNMQQAQQKMGSAARTYHLLAALGCLLCTLGLLLPAIAELPAAVVPVTAGLAAALMLLSIPLHLKSKDQPRVFVSLVLLLFAAVITWGRLAIAPL